MSSIERAIVELRGFTALERLPSLAATMLGLAAGGGRRGALTMAHLILLRVHSRFVEEPVGAREHAQIGALMTDLADLIDSPSVDRFDQVATAFGALVSSRRLQ